MRYFTCVLVTLCIGGSTLCAAYGQQPNTSEKQQASKRGTQNPEAYTLYLKGRSHLDKETRSDVESAISYFNKAIAKDPGYALAYEGLARAYGTLPDYGDSPVEDIPKAKAAARKALELDPTLASPHVSLGGDMMAHDWDFAGGVAEFKKALELDPDNADTLRIYADNISMIGGMEQEAITAVNRAHQLDPQSRAITLEVGQVYITARKYDEAIAVLKKLAQENPTYPDPHFWLCIAYWGKQMYPQVVEEYKTSAQLSQVRNDSEFASALERGYRSAGWRGALTNGVETLKAQRKTDPSSAYGGAYWIAFMYGQLGEKDQAFRWLDTAYQEREEALMGLKTDFQVDPLRSDPRFAELERKVGLPQGTQNPEAYALYLKGRSYWDKRTLSDLDTAVSYFNQAIAKDSGYALAYSALADAYAVLPDYGGSPIEDIPKSNAAARKALELDPTLARPHAAMGYTKFGNEWDFAGGEAEFKKAIELDPNDATVHQWYAESLFMLGGREREALAEINRAYQLDPLSLIIRRDLGADHIFIRQYDEAIAVCKKLADENPRFSMAHYCLSDAYWRKRMYSQSLGEYKVAAQLSGDRNDSEYAAAMEQGFRSAGWEGALRKAIEASLAQRKTGNSSAYAIAASYAELGEKDQAFQWLNTAFQEHDQGLLGLNTDSSLDPIRSDPRFAELVRKVGLPQ